MINDVFSGNDDSAPDLSQEDYAEHTGGQLAAALESTDLFQAVEVNANLGQVHIMGRVKSDKEPEFMAAVGWPMIEAAKESGLKLFFGKQYVLSPSRKFAWVIGLAAEDLRDAATTLCESFESAIPRREISSMPLSGSGAPQSGGAVTGKRGASPVVVGRM